MKEYDFAEHEAVELSASRSKVIGRYHLMMGENPIYIITCQYSPAGIERGIVMKRKLPRILLAAGASGSGKTLITCGLLQVLVNREKKVASFKCGPDYIDPMFHTRVIGTKSRNLDTSFFQRGAYQVSSWKKLEQTVRLQ